MTSKNEQMDWLANEILAVLESSTDDRSYIESKRGDFIGLDRMSAARKINNLDSENQLALAIRLGISIEDLEAFCRVLKSI